MSKIHYFQRYSSIENTVTNNTLQLLARIYDYSPSVASAFLTNITGEPVDIGIEISQQGRAGVAVPDGSIIQRSFKILIEAKVDSAIGIDQLLRHAGTFGNESQKILLLLTKHAECHVEHDARRKIHEKFPNVVFKNITYESICNAIKILFSPHEAAMKALIEDYIEYCNDINLFDQSKFLLRIVPCGQSLGINKKYGMYFQPSDRGYTEHSFIGIYANKSVQGVLEVKSVFDAAIVGDTLEKKFIQGVNTAEFDENIKNMIDEAKKECGWEIATGHRFFCGTVVDTDFRKLSPGGIQGARFQNLRDILGDFADIHDIALRLRNFNWE